MNTISNITRKILAFGVLGLLCLPLPAIAISQTVTVQGTTTTIGTIPSGTPWSASVTYDTSVPPTSITPTQVEWFPNPSFEYSFTIGSQTFSFPPLVSNIKLLVLHTPLPSLDSIIFAVNSPSFNDIGGNSYGQLRVSILGNDQMMDDLTLPLVADFSQIRSIQLLGSHNTGYDLLGEGSSIQITPTPEPGTMLLFGTGLAAMVA